MSIFEIYDTAKNGLDTMRQVMSIAADNVANALTPGYKTKSVVISARSDDSSFSEVLLALNGDEKTSALLNSGHKGMGCMVARVIVHQGEGTKVYAPGHPLADAEGNIEMSNVDSAGEMLSMSNAVSSYKANLAIVEMAKKAAQEALNMTKNS